jgi:hypothetical protein
LAAFVNPIEELVPDGIVSALAADAEVFAVVLDGISDEATGDTMGVEDATVSRLIVDALTWLARFPVLGTTADHDEPSASATSETSP